MPQLNTLDVVCLVLALACIARGWGLKARLMWKHRFDMDIERRLYQRAADNIRKDYQDIRDQERRETLEALYALEKNPFEPGHHARLREAIETLEEALGITREEAA